MLAQRLSGALERRGLHYAWVITGVTFLAMLTTSAALGLPGAMLKPMTQEFGWSTEALSSVFAVRFALYGLLGPFAAVVITRFGLRGIMVAAVGLIAASAATGQLIFLPVAAWMIEHLGWRYAVIPVSVACAAVALLAMLLMRDRPRDLGLRAYGEPADAPPEAAAAPAPSKPFWPRCRRRWCRSRSSISA
jgi:sugar phosphate permease